MKEIKVPELAESVTEGTIAEWLVNEGDQVSKGDPIVELETDKINLEINSDYDGVIKEFIKQAGETVEVGDVIAKLDESGSGDQEDQEDQDTKKAKEDEPETKDQDSKEEKSEEKAPEKSEETKESSDNKEKEQKSKQKEEDQDKSSKPVASPAARKKARELGIDLNEIKARDPLGRIRPEDVEEAAKSKKSSQKESSEKDQKQTQTSKKDNTDDRVERVKMSRRRQTIAKRLVEAQHNAAMLTTFNEVDMTAVMDVRKRRKDAFYKKHGVKLGFMSFFTKAVVAALKKFPLLNAEIQGDEIVKKKFYDIGIAVSAEDGLVVPVVRDADRLSFAGIEEGISNLAEKARTNKLTLNDLQGGSFTITNGGIFGSLYSTPILNTPQVGILGMHTIQKRPVVIDEDDNVEVRPMMYIALSYDHRIVDGAEAVQFLTTIKTLLENPEDLLLEG